MSAFEIHPLEIGHISQPVYYIPYVYIDIIGTKIGIAIYIAIAIVTTAWQSESLCAGRAASKGWQPRELAGAEW